MIYAHLHLLYMPCLIAGVEYCKCRSPRHTQTFRPVLQPHEISSEVVFRPLSMDERPTVVLGLLALWTGPEKEFPEISAEPWRIATDFDPHRGCCPSLFLLLVSCSTRSTHWWHSAWPEPEIRWIPGRSCWSMRKLHGVAPSEELPLAALVGVLLIMQVGDIWR